MTDETRVEAPTTADKAKLTVAVLIVIAGVAAFYVLASQPTWMRWAAVAASIVLGAVVALLTRYGAEFRRFVELARIELRKIVWPSRQETGMTTVVVFAFVIIAGLFFWAIDWVLAYATKFLTGQGS